MKVCKLVVMGTGGVGKSALILQFVSGQFLKQYDPTIEDFYTKKIDVDGSAILLEILDTAGQDEYSAMRDQYILSGEAFILVYSVNNLRSFTEVCNLKKQIDRLWEEKSLPIVLVGNMSDVKAQREVTAQDGEKLACEWGCPFFETSAKENHHVQEIFHEIVREERKQHHKSSSGPHHSHSRCVCL